MRISADNADEYMGTDNINETPFVSILIPTLNAGRVLGMCLQSISTQDYPKEKVEVIIADGGSTDNTLEIVKKYRAKIYKNKLITAESGKAEALRHASGEIIALIDSDNILPDTNWLLRLTAPFLDKVIMGSEPWEYTYRKQDSLVNRYCALMGMNDPYVYFVGNYDRICVLSGKWTGIRLKEENEGDYLKVTIDGNLLSTIGANGALWRKAILKKAVGDNDYLFDTDVPYTVLDQNNPYYYAKVKTGIIHLYCHQIKDFIRKQKRRAKDFFYLENKGQRTRTFQSIFSKQAQFILSTIIIIPLLVQSVKGYLKKPDLSVWLFHPLACWITLWIYSTETIKALIKPTQMNRVNWQK